MFTRRTQAVSPTETPPPECNFLPSRGSNHSNYFVLVKLGSESVVWIHLQELLYVNDCVNVCCSEGLRYLSHNQGSGGLTRAFSLFFPSSFFSKHGCTGRKPSLIHEP